jgi:lipase
MLLHSYEWGLADAPVVVCLHGVAGHGRRFRRLAQEDLAGRFRVVSLDLRGHGRSQPDAPWTIETFRDDVLETVDSLGIGRADWIGHSFGGRLIGEVAMVDPGRVGRAVLLDPALRLPGQLAFFLAEDERRKPDAFDSREDAYAWRKARTVLADDALIEEELDDHLEVVGDNVRFRYASSAAIAIYGELARPSPDPAVFPGEVLMVLATTNSPVGMDEAQRYRDGLGDRLTEFVLPVGHNLLWEAYEDVRDRIAEFLPD